MENELWTTILTNIILPAFITGAGTYILFRMKERSEKSLKQEEVTGLKINSLSVMQGTLDALSIRYDESRNTIERLDRRIDALRGEVDALQTQLQTETEARLAAEKDNQELRKGIQKLIVQMKKRDIIPDWEPKEREKSTKGDSSENTSFLQR